MKPKLLLQLSDDCLRASFQPPQRGPLRGLVDTLRRSKVAPAIGVTEVMLKIAPESGALGASLDRAIADLQLPGDALSGASLEVQLGLRHARVGLLAASGTAGIPAESREAYVLAWIRETMRVDPQAQIIRWQSVPGHQALLVSCIDKEVFDTLTEFGTVQRMRFTSCRPALLSACTVSDRRAAPYTLVWTEQSHTSGRGGRVQLVRMESGQPKAFWRGWLPPSSSHSDIDPHLEGAIRRFQHRHQATGDEQLRRLQWLHGAKAAAALD